ncbi:MAG TPA: IS66 family insertion sequence element accessory protein TnpB [Candidatus Xenobia bacterium]|jgi:transposase
MLTLDRVQVYIGIGSVDMRKSIDGLSLLVSQQWSLDLFTGHMFAFTNRRRTVVKVLYWDSNGFALWQKRLDKDRFKWPESREEVMRIGHREFRWLLEGLDIRVHQGHAELHYSAVA